MVGERDGDGSAAGAYVEDAEWLVGGESVEDGFDEELGFGAGDEDGGGDLEGDAVEVLGAGDVLDGFEGEAAGEEGFVGGLVIGGEGSFGMGEEGGVGDVEGVEEEELGVACGVGLEVWVGCEAQGGCG